MSKRQSMTQSGERLGGVPTDVVRLLDEYGLHPSRALGQNFLSDANTARRIARLADVGPGDKVVEIGPGLGALTVALVSTGAAVRAVELDRHLLPILAATVGPLGVVVEHADALVVDWTSMLDGHGPHVIVANLPYNVAVPIVLRLLDEAPSVSRMLVMVQREVAERMVAEPGSRTYGSVSVRVAYWATATIVGRVPPTVFVPKPKVESALVMLVRRDQPAVDPAVVSSERLFSIVRAGFAHRRKMLRGALSGLVDPGAFASAGVGSDARAETLDVEAWGRLAAWPAPHPT